MTFFCLLLYVEQAHPYLISFGEKMRLIRVHPLIMLLVLLGSQKASAQDPNWALSGLLGTVTVGQTQWQRLDMQPHIRLGALEAVLDIELFLDETGNIQDLGWDFSTRKKGLESLFRKIYYVQYGHPTDRDSRVYLRLGALESITLGSGLLMRNYRNTQDAPGIKRTGLDLQLQHLFNQHLTIRTIVSDLLDLDGGGPIVGSRVVFHPTQQWDMGVTVVVDTDQLNGLPDSVRNNRPRDAYGSISLDLIYPLISKPSLQIQLYGAIARALNSGGGLGLSGPGLKMDLGGLHIQGEYRWVTGRFQPGHFDALYDLNRATVDSVTSTILTREAALLDQSMQGIFADASLHLGHYLQAGATYQFLTGNGTEAQILEGRAQISPKALAHISKISLAEAYYEKRFNSLDLGTFFDGTADTRFGYRLGISPMPQLTLFSEVEFTYEPDGQGGYLRRRTLNIQSKINF
ncbi:MAG: hypothetical protein ACI8V2_002711 [Candidatus Latescibacterota bacterium]